MICRYVCLSSQLQKTIYVCAILYLYDRFKGSKQLGNYMAHTILENTKCFKWHNMHLGKYLI